MSTRLDLKKIDVIDYLESLQIENILDEGPEIRFSCPYPDHANGDRNPSAYMNAAGEDRHARFFCHGCKQKGDAVDLAEFVLDISRLEVVRMLKEAYQPGYIDPDKRGTADEVRDIVRTPKKRRAKVEKQPELDERVLDDLAIDWELAEEARSAGGGHPATDYMLERGFTPDTLTHWQFGYDEISDRITFAVRDERNRLVGFKARAYYDRHPKYLVLGDKEGREPRYGFKPYYTGQIIFGLVEAVHMEDAANVDRHRHFIICEGELNAIACWQAGYAAIALNGSNFTEYQEKLLKFHADSVTLFLDSDEAGTSAMKGWSDQREEWHPGIVARLKDFMIVKAVPDHEGDPASMDESEIAELLADARGAVTTLIR